MRLIQRCLRCIAFMALLCISMYSFAQAKSYKFSIPKDCSILGYSTIGMTTGFILQSRLSPLTVIQIANLDNTISSFDSYATKHYSSTLARRCSYLDVGLALSCIGSVGILSIAQSESKSEFWKNSCSYAGMYIETIALAYSTNLLLKNAVHRARPFVYNSKVALEEKMTKEARQSFFSLNTTIASASTFYAASIFSRYYGKVWQSYVAWGLASTLPIGIGAMRIESGKHFLSDVLVGYSFGALCGTIVPCLHVDRTYKTVSIHVSPMGMLVLL